MKSILVNKIVQTERLTLDELFTTKNRVYTFLNPVSYLKALEYKDVFCRFDGIYADGELLVAAIKHTYGVTVTRRSMDMTSLAKKLFEYAEKNGRTVYIVASRQEKIEKAMLTFKEHYPCLRFAGYRNGYFASEKEMDEEAERIAKLNPDFVVVGMGMLMQERFLLKVKEAGYKGIGFSCGGFIHQTQKDEMEYYPAWMDRMNIRFVYRMYKEKHTRKRYLQAAILFPARFLLEKLTGR